MFKSLKPCGGGNCCCEPKSDKKDQKKKNPIEVLLDESYEDEVDEILSDVRRAVRRAREKYEADYKLRSDSHANFEEQVF